MPPWTITPAPPDTPPVAALLWEYVAEVGRRVAGRPATDAEIRAVLARDPHTGLAPPHGEFLLARTERGALLGCAGLRLLPALPGTAELKRMYVRPAHRGTGLGRALLLAAEESARTLGATRTVLDTRTGLHEARALYTAHGYRETAPYNTGGDAEHWYVKELG
ncbi:GNAT family N-acetyltransferase [Streptomyces sp. ODS28]|uniref:GNAT family N-acetyltransferase n=1 Tax=Streptomyces sp. ODS28 TaxID=3136688 RepID=UPI0031E7E7D0